MEIVSFIIMLTRFIVTTIFDLMIFVVMFHLILEFMGTYHHPIRQIILRYTQPLLDPLHKIFPVYRQVDVGLVILLVLLEIIKLVLIFLLEWKFPNLALLLVWSLFLLIRTLFNFYFFALLLRLIVSWAIPIYSNHPATQILFIITEPVLRPIRKRVQIKRFDWTPIAAMIIAKLAAWLVTLALIALYAPLSII